jgi:DNA-binding MarR family transcriptional regulator
MKEPLRMQLADEAVQAYLELGDAIRLASLPGWITADLTTSQVKAVILLEHHGPLPVGKLAELLGIGKPAASIIVQQLVEQEMVERSEDTLDRRRTLVSLTAKGSQLMSGQREQREGRLRRWFSQLDDDELTALRRGLGALAGIARSEQAG